MPTLFANDQICSIINRPRGQQITNKTHPNHENSPCCYEQIPCIPIKFSNACSEVPIWKYRKHKNEAATWNPVLGSVVKKIFKEMFTPSTAFNPVFQRWLGIVSQYSLCTSDAVYLLFKAGYFFFLVWNCNILQLMSEYCSM
jgi:hypothetical protein